METSERNIEANMNELIGRIEAKYEKMSKGQKRLAEYVKENYDLSVKGMIEYLGLLNQDYESIAEGCHFYDKASGKERKFKERKVVR